MMAKLLINPSRTQTARKCSINYLVILFGLGLLFFFVTNVIVIMRLHGAAGLQSPLPHTPGFAIPHIYWINLDTSIYRRELMMKSFASLGIPSDHHHRVPALTTHETKKSWLSGRFSLHSLVHLEEIGFRDKPHLQNIYSYQEGACLLSHLNAIRKAYEAGHEIVLIVEDDAVISKSFLDEWRYWIERAPNGWKVLQFATVNLHVIRQGLRLRELFVNWQPYHWSTRAYVMNRLGMSELMDKAHEYTLEGESIWRIQQAPMVVADEVVFTLVGNAYTSTGLWIDGGDFNSTVQSKDSTAEAKEDIMRFYHHLGDIKQQIALKKSYVNSIFQESLIVFMNMRVSNTEGMLRDMEWISQDSKELCQFHPKCDWEINVVFADSSLVEIFLISSSDFTSNVHFHLKESLDPFNKFSFVRDFVDIMANYDFVLLKDNDMRISGFPWRTFFQRKENAVVSGPLRQAADEALTYNLVNRQRKADQKSYIHEAHNWVMTSWSADLFACITPTEVPILEMYFVLLDAKFANLFFGTILTSGFFDQSSDWGPDLLWCQAAKEWDSGRPGCYLVPLVSSHEDSKQIDKSNRLLFNRNGERALNTFKNDPMTGMWMNVSMEWSLLVHAQRLPQIERNCRALLGIDTTPHFDLQMCSMKLILSFMHYNYVPALHAQDNSPGMIKYVQNKTGSWTSCLPPRKLFSGEHLLTNWEKHPDSSHTIISCTRIHYRTPIESLRKIVASDETLVIGVLSSGPGEGIIRRNSIRSTWASRQSNVFFIVAGPWSAIEWEYEKYKDLLWLDIREIYLAEISHLTFKTESFLSIFFEHVMLKSKSIQYLLKTDDDSYVALDKLYFALFEQDWGLRMDYWGKCKTERLSPHRNRVIPWQKKWYIPYDAYPYSKYPPWAMGAGYALSRKFLTCAFGNQHAAQIRYLPNEDVAIGMLAERCNVSCINDNRVWLRYDSIRDGVSMDRRIIQHYIKSEDEMHEFHRSMMA